MRIAIHILILEENVKVTHKLKYTTVYIKTFSSKCVILLKDITFTFIILRILVFELHFCLNPCIRYKDSDRGISSKSIEIATNLYLSHTSRILDV